MDQLSIELVEAQKTRSDLLKWKIVLVSGLAAVGFGLSEKPAGANGYDDLVLCCIPIVCAYVDILCRHLSLRIFVIGSFRRLNDAGDKDGAKAYEAFVDKVRKRGAFSLESGAIFLSSAIISTSLIYLPSALNHVKNVPALPHGTILNTSGWLGLIFTATIELIYRLLRFVVRTNSEVGSLG